MQVAVLEAIETAGAALQLLLPFGPDLNPIGMACSKMKVLLKKVGARTIDDLWQSIAEAIDLFSPKECENSFSAAGYDRD